jgi:hypothetical protein
VKPGTVWIVVVVALLALSLGAQGVLIVAALSDPSFAVEPDYEWKAEHWDDIARGRAASAALGWTVALETKPADLPGHVDLFVTVADRSGAAVDAASVSVEAFHNARADLRFATPLAATEAGSYGGRLALARPGLWEFRLEIARGEERFVDAIRQSIAIPRPPGRMSP